MGKHKTSYHTHSSCSHCIHLCSPCDQVYCCRCIRTWGNYNYYPTWWGGSSITIGDTTTVPYFSLKSDSATMTLSSVDTAYASTRGSNVKFNYHTSDNHKHVN